MPSRFQALRTVELFQSFALNLASDNVMLKTGKEQRLPVRQEQCGCSRFRSFPCSFWSLCFSFSAAAALFKTVCVVYMYIVFKYVYIYIYT